MRVPEAPEGDLPWCDLNEGHGPRHNMDQPVQILTVKDYNYCAEPKSENLERKNVVDWKGFPNCYAQGGKADVCDYALCSSRDLLSFMHAHDASSYLTHRMINSSGFTPSK